MLRQNAVYPIASPASRANAQTRHWLNHGPFAWARVSASAWRLIAAAFAFGCSTTLDPTVHVLDDGEQGQGGTPPFEVPSDCTEVEATGRIFLACSGPTATFAEAERDCQARGGELARITSADENQALLSQIRELPTQSNLWLGGQRDAARVWSWPDGSVFWNGLADGADVPGVFVNWQSGEPNDDSTVTDEPELCVAIALFDGGWRDRACSLRLSYFCELGPTP